MKSAGWKPQKHRWTKDTIIGMPFLTPLGKRKCFPSVKKKGDPGVNSVKMIESLTTGLLLTNQFSNWTNQSKKSPGPTERTQNNLSI